MVARLQGGQVEFLIVGGVSAVLQGAAITIMDLGLCYRRTPENFGRLVRALAPVKPRPRGFPPEMPLVFDERTIGFAGNFTLDIGAESLDLLGEMSGIGGYESVVDKSVGVTLGGRVVKVLSLEQLIATKEAAGRTKDLAALPELRATLSRRREHEKPGP
jgi:hypothetical protein